MNSSTSVNDPVMARITAAVTAFHGGDDGDARAELLATWREIGVTGDPFHRCTLAHYLADMYTDPAQALMWDTRALDAAAALSDERAQRYHGGLQVAGFYPSLHLNLADDLRRLASFEAAAEHIAAARARLDALDDNGYGAMIRQAVGEVSEAITQRSTAPRASAPGTT